jgi:hypothetical protein
MICWSAEYDAAAAVMCCNSLAIRTYTASTLKTWEQVKCNREIYDALEIRNIVLCSLRKQLDLMADISTALKERTQSAIPDEKNH